MTRTRANFVSGLLGGLVVAVVVGILLAAGVVETDNDKAPATPSTSLATPDRPSNGNSSGAGKSVHEIYTEDGPGVAFIQTRTGTGAATGSGFVLDTRGYILTNAHVVEGATQVQVAFDDSGSNLTDAKVIGRDPSTDLAVIKVDPSKAKLRPLELGDSDKALVGDPVVAIGNPFGYSRTVTTGIVSAKQRRIEAPNGFQIDNVIQTDAAINPGNSGGPLIDAQGRVIGINSQIATAGVPGSVGIGFAVPVNTAKQVFPQLEKNGKIDRPYLGITSARITPEIAKALKLPTGQGALVQDVVPGGPAAKAGIRGGSAAVDGTGLKAGGDLIVAIDGRPVNNPNDVAAAISNKKPGDKVTIKLIRGGKTIEVTVTLGKRPDRVPGQPSASGGGGGGLIPPP
jgi:S1-C subfamily serine protease